MMGGARELHETLHVGAGDRCRYCSLACDELARAFKAAGFYPPGHPRRLASLQAAHAALLVCVRDRELVLVISRGGFVSSGDGATIEAGPLSRTLAQELFIRRVRRLTFLPDVIMADLGSLLDVLTMDPQAIQADGGMEALMAERRIATIWANELDLALILRKRAELEAAADDAGAAPLVDEAQPGSAGGAVEQLPPVPERPLPELAELLAVMERETDSERYRQLARSLVGCCETLKSSGDYEPIVSALHFLLRQGTEEEGSVERRGYALLALDQVADEPVIDYLVQLVEKSHVAKESLFPVLRQLGAKVVVPLVERLTVAESKVVRKNLSAALVAVGDEAVTLLTERLADERWYVVRNVAAILGEIGDAGSIGKLAQCLDHEDERVRKEALRSLSRIGGSEVETEMLRVLAGGDFGLKRQAVISLGLMRSRAAIGPLCTIVDQGDFFMRSFALKIDAVQALERIGDPRAVPCLFQVLQRRSWLAGRRRLELKVATVAAIGQLGDAAAATSLQALIAKGGRFGQACVEATESIRTRLECQHG